MSFEDADKEWESFSTYDSEFLDGINRAYGINDFNSDLGDNIILWESGNNSNNKLEIMRLNTYFASAIDQYLSNK